MDKTKLEAQERMSALFHQTEGMLQVMMAAKLGDLHDETVHNSVWAVLEMVREAHDLARQVAKA